MILSDRQQRAWLSEESGHRKRSRLMETNPKNTMHEQDSPRFRCLTPVDNGASASSPLLTAGMPSGQAELPMGVSLGPACLLRVLYLGRKYSVGVSVCLLGASFPLRLVPSRY